MNKILQNDQSIKIPRMILTNEISFLYVDKNEKKNKFTSSDEIDVGKSVLALSENVFP